MGTPVAPCRLKAQPEKKSHPRGKHLQSSFPKAPNIMSYLKSPITNSLTAKASSTRQHLGLFPETCPPDDLGHKLGGGTEYFASVWRYDSFPDWFFE